MIQRAKSSLPAILKQYDSEYEPNYQTLQRSQTAKYHEEKTTSLKQEHSKTTEDLPPQPMLLSDSARSTNNQGHLKSCGNKESRRAKSPQSMKTSENKHRSSASAPQHKRFAKLTDTWHQARQIVREEQLSALQQKVALQRELIRAQDALASQRRQDEQNRLDETRHLASSGKQARLAALQQKCRQSLKDDQEQPCGDDSQKNFNVNSPTEAAEEEPKLQAPPTCIQAERHGSKEHTPTAQFKHQPKRQAFLPTTDHIKLRQGKKKDKRGSVRLPFIASSDHQEEDSQDAPKNKPPPSDDDPLAWHRAQLCSLYGSEANLYFDPSMEAPNRKPVDDSRLPKNTDTYIAASVVWDSLREESQSRVGFEEADFFMALKKPRTYRVMDQSPLQKIYLMRHRMELMYRMSQKNRDQTNVLFYNNPLPNMNEDQSVGKYIFPKVDYQRREHPVLKDDTRKISMKKKRKSSVIPVVQDEALNTILRNVYRPRFPSAPHYHFLTSKAATSCGAFSKRFRQEREKNAVPQPHLAHGKAKSSLGLRDYHPYRTDPQGWRRDPLTSQALSTREVLWQHCTSKWEPLSQPALEEYKEKKDVRGVGDFRHGQATMWSVVPSTSS